MPNLGSLGPKDDEQTVSVRVVRAAPRNSMSAFLPYGGEGGELAL